MSFLVPGPPRHRSYECETSIHEFVWVWISVNPFAMNAAANNAGPEASERISRVLTLKRLHDRRIVQSQRGLAPRTRRLSSQATRPLRRNPV
jgi:hypothetical protein